MPSNQGAAGMSHPIATERLVEYLRDNSTPLAGEVRVEQFSGGQSNPTYRISAGVNQYVLRRKPPGDLLPSAHAIEREYRVIKALANTDVPVPRVFALCEDASVVGTPFFLMEHVEGRVYYDPSLPGMRPEERSALFDELNRTFAALHAVDPAAVGLLDYGRSADYLARQIARWTKQYRASETERIDAMEELIGWLPSRLPDSEETSIVHGDFRIDNVIFHPTAPRILAVLDWELSTLGHPLVDFAYHCMAWRVTPDEFRGLKGHDLDTLGIPTELRYVKSYCARTGRTGIANWDYYLVFNMFRMAAILQGVLARALAGNAPSPNSLETGRRARKMAEAGWRLASQ
jgi:aminoglycoside phosphotransferase (APT) family kinase protein